MSPDKAEYHKRIALLLFRLTAEGADYHVRVVNRECERAIQGSRDACHRLERFTAAYGLHEDSMWWGSCSERLFQSLDGAWGTPIELQWAAERMLRPTVTSQMLYRLQRIGILARTGMTLVWGGRFQSPRLFGSGEIDQASFMTEYHLLCARKHPGGWSSSFANNFGRFVTGAAALIRVTHGPNLNCDEPPRVTWLKWVGPSRRDALASLTTERLRSLATSIRIMIPTLGPEDRAWPLTLALELVTEETRRLSLGPAEEALLAMTIEDEFARAVLADRLESMGHKGLAYRWRITGDGCDSPSVPLEYRGP